MKNSEIFIKLYSELEYTIKRKYHYQEQAVLKASEKELRRYKNDLDTIRQFRNLLTHSKPFGIDYIAEPHEKLINTLKKILEDIEDEMIYKKCTPVNKLVYATKEDKVFSFMNKLESHVYSHIPILDNKKVIGILSENRLFNYFVHLTTDNQKINITESTSFNDILNYISLENTGKEEYLFMSKHSKIDEAANAIKDAYLKRNKRIGMIFITENGNTNEDLIGIITPWDILGKNELFIA